MTCIQSKILLGLFFVGLAFLTSEALAEVSVRTHRELIGHFQDLVLSDQSTKHPDEAVITSIRRRLPIEGRIEEIGAKSLGAMVSLAGQYCDQWSQEKQFPKSLDGLASALMTRSFTEQEREIYTAQYNSGTEGPFLTCTMLLVRLENILN